MPRSSLPTRPRASLPLLLRVPPPPSARAPAVRAPAATAARSRYLAAPPLRRPAEDATTATRSLRAGTTSTMHSSGNPRAWRPIVHTAPSPSSGGKSVFVRMVVVMGGRGVHSRSRFLGSGITKLQKSEHPCPAHHRQQGPRRGRAAVGRVPSAARRAARRAARQTPSVQREQLLQQLAQLVVAGASRHLSQRPRRSRLPSAAARPPLTCCRCVAVRSDRTGSSSRHGVTFGCDFWV